MEVKYLEVCRWWNRRRKQKTEEVKGSRSEGGKGVYGPKTNRSVREKAEVEVFYLQYTKVFLNPQIYSLFHMHERVCRINSRITALRSTITHKVVTSLAKVSSTRMSSSAFEPTTKRKGTESRIPKALTFSQPARATRTVSCYICHHPLLLTAWLESHQC
jgi:hypothetical protein